MFGFVGCIHNMCLYSLRIFTIFVVDTKYPVIIVPFVKYSGHVAEGIRGITGEDVSS